MWIAALAAALDRLTKVLAARASDGALIPGLLNLRCVENRGMAFSLLSGRAALLSVVTLLILLGLTAWLVARPEQGGLLRAGLWLLVGGGLGNLYDRLVFGQVADFLEFAFVRFAVFNVADVCVCVGAGLAMLGAILKERRERNTHG